MSRTYKAQRRKPKNATKKSTSERECKEEILEGVTEWQNSESTRTSGKEKAEDIGDGVTYASGWERDMARFLIYLQRRGIIEGYAYEPTVFSFQSLGYKRGPFTYIPDFAFRYRGKIRGEDLAFLRTIFDEIHPGRTVYLEVKGQETGRDRSKWRRFRKHAGYPLEVVKRDKLRRIQELKDDIPNWESMVY